MSDMVDNSIRHGPTYWFCMGVFVALGAYGQHWLNRNNID